ncbi:MAG: LysM peptidoglycan-binding domain-containing protein [Anaerolineae bacterium]
MSKRIPALRIKTLLVSAAAALIAAGCASQPEPVAPPPEPEVIQPPATARSPAPPAVATTAPVVSETYASQSGSTSGVVLNPRHPTRYVVRKGDTLWDISAMFLRDPWYWPEIWYVNPQVANPHLIYPGDVLRLVYMDGRPQVILERGGAVRMSPRVRREPLADAIPTIPYDRIAAFLGRPTVLDADSVKDAPYILTDRREHLIHGANSEVYVRGDTFDRNQLYNVFSIEDELVDPDDGDLLGYMAVWVGEGSVVRDGDPATMYLSMTAREALNGDKVLPVEDDFPLYFQPSAPAGDVEGQIISVVDGVSVLGQYHVVALNRGSADGLAPGNVLSIWQAGREVEDRFGGGKVELPEEYSGLMMVFRTFDDMSYGIIVRSTSEIRILDKVRNP